MGEVAIRLRVGRGRLAALLARVSDEHQVSHGRMPPVTGASPTPRQLVQVA
jgi:hypothetical protein